MGGYVRTPEELHRAAMISAAWTRRHLTRDRWYRRAFLSLVGAGCAVLVALFSLALPPNISAALGHGVRGSYVPQTLVLVGGGRGVYVWSGTFTSESGHVDINVDYFDHLPAGARVGSSFPALYKNHQAFPVRGSLAWVLVLFFLVMSAAGLVACVWLGPVRALRRRTSPQREGTGSGAL